jgi:putative addiction module killer protein
VITILRTSVFDGWLRALRDPVGKARILARIRSAEAGNFGDCASVGNGISEMRIHAGPGYRIYFCRRGVTVYLLVCAGDKSSQQRDIGMARALLAELGH